jgi:hypothetical protein
MANEGLTKATNAFKDAARALKRLGSTQDALDLIVRDIYQPRSTAGERNDLANPQDNFDIGHDPLPLE